MTPTTAPSSTARALYGNFRLRRVYYSAFSPIPNSPKSVPLAAPPLMREHRLYQADFLLRGYGFSANELFQGRGTWPWTWTPSWPGPWTTAACFPWT